MTIKTGFRVEPIDGSRHSNLKLKEGNAVLRFPSRSDNKTGLNMTNKSKQSLKLSPARFEWWNHSRN